MISKVVYSVGLLNACRKCEVYWHILYDLSTGESGEEVLYGTTDGQIGLIQLSRLSYIVWNRVYHAFVYFNDTI